MPQKKTANRRPVGGARIVPEVLIVGAGLCALGTIPTLLGIPHTSGGGNTHSLVFVLFVGLAVALRAVADVVKRTPVRDRRGPGYTDEEILAGLEAQFDDGPTRAP